MLALKCRAQQYLRKQNKDMKNSTTDKKQTKKLKAQQKEKNHQVR